MSYDLSVFAVSPGQSAAEAWEAVVAAEALAPPWVRELDVASLEPAGVVLDDEGHYLAVTIPYGLDRVEQVFAGLVSAVERLRARGDVAVYDEQQGRVVDLADDLREIVALYQRVV